MIFYSFFLYFLTLRVLKVCSYVQDILFCTTVRKKKKVQTKNSRHIVVSINIILIISVVLVKKNNRSIL